MRLSAQAAHFHAGFVHFPHDAAWLGELMLELLGFPGVRPRRQSRLGFTGARFHRLA
jgi:phage terminase large subunit-like protein